MQHKSIFLKQVACVHKAIRYAKKRRDQHSFYRTLYKTEVTVRKDSKLHASYRKAKAHYATLPDPREYFPSWNFPEKVFRTSIYQQLEAEILGV